MIPLSELVPEAMRWKCPQCRALMEWNGLGGWSCLGKRFVHSVTEGRWSVVDQGWLAEWNRRAEEEHSRMQERTRVRLEGWKFVIGSAQ